MATQNFSNKRMPVRRGPGRRLQRRYLAIAREQERLGLHEYVEYLQKPRRLLFTNLMAGMMRGMGFAVGFSLLGAIVIYIVQKLALANLPGIGDFFAEIVRIVQMKLY